jgi:hypothetical protein
MAATEAILEQDQTKFEAGAMHLHLPDNHVEIPVSYHSFFIHAAIYSIASIFSVSVDAYLIASGSPLRNSHWWLPFTLFVGLCKSLASSSKAWCVRKQHSVAEGNRTAMVSTYSDATGVIYITCLMIRPQTRALNISH